MQHNRISGRREHSEQRIISSAYRRRVPLDSRYFFFVIVVVDVAVVVVWQSQTERERGR